MGCASSSPLVEGGKNLVDAAKETANDAVSKGEQALHDVGETAKDGIESVKDTMSSAYTTAENSVGNVVGKIGETFSFTSSQVKEGVNNMDAAKDEMIHNASDATAEAISEAETVLASEADHVKEVATENMEAANKISNDVSSKVEDMKHEAVDMKNDIVDSIHIEEIDQSFDMLGDSVNKVETKVEEVLNITPGSSPAKEIKKEEDPPTFWEAAADAIVLRKTMKEMGMEEPQNERMFPIEEYEIEELDKPRDISDDLIISDLESSQQLN